MGIEYCNSLGRYERRPSCRVRIGRYEIGGGAPIAVQSMTNTDTGDTEATVAQIERIFRAGGHIVRVTAQGRREADNLVNIMSRLRSDGCDAAVVADVHFVPEIADIAAESVDKVRINPGNYRLSEGRFEALIERCRRRGVALRIGVNHGSLAKRIVDTLGDTPEGMVASAMEFLRICRREKFDQVVVSMKSSNTRVMVCAYRRLVAAMRAEGMDYPLHLGVTEAGNGIEGRVKSAVGIGALLADGIGDTIRVSLTEPPENEIPVAQLLADYFAVREGEFDVVPPENFSPYDYRRRASRRCGCIGGGQTVATHDELDDGALSGAAVLDAVSGNPVAEWRSAVFGLDEQVPVVLHRRYDDASLETMAVKAAADFGVMLLDGLADGIWIEAPQFTPEEIRDVELMILQASRVRFSRTEYIACPGCGRTLYDLQSTLERIKAATSHLKDLKIGVMGCIVNGPGEMADADYGYVGAAPGRITLYRGREVIERNIPQQEALEHLIALIRADGRWHDPQ